MLYAFYVAKSSRRVYVFVMYDMDKEVVIGAAYPIAIVVEWLHMDLE